MKYLQLREIADIQLGKMLSPKAKTGSEPFPYLRNQNIQWGRIDVSDLATMDFSQSDRRKFKLRSGDLLICEGGEPGRCAVWGSQIENCFYQKALHRVRPHCDMADSHFLGYWIRYQASVDAFNDQNAKTTIAHLPLVRLEKLPVPDIAYVRQKEIAENLNTYLAEVGTARAAATAQLGDISALANAIVFDSVLSVTSTRSVGDVLNEVKHGIGTEWASHPVLGATREGLAPAKEPPGKNPGRYKPATPGTVFYNPMRIVIGSIAYVDDNDTPGITSPDYVVLRGKPGVVDSRWFYYWLRSPLGARCIQLLARGAVRERMLFNRLAEGEIALPSFAVQQRASAALRELKPLKMAIASRLSEINLLPQKILAQAFEI